MKATDKNFIPVIAYLNPERDAKILAWLKARPNRSAAVRDVLAAHVQAPPGIISEAVKLEATINTQTIHQAIVEALTEHFDLTIIRQMIEAAISSVLGRAILAQSTQLVQDEESDAVLDDLDGNLIWD